MRQRKVKNEAQRIENLEHLLVRDCKRFKNEWEKLLREKLDCFDGEIYLELGCGRGHFIADLAEANPCSFFLGVEGRSSVVLRAMELIDEKKLDNVLFIPEFIIHMENHFGKEELSGIYLNFSDPWPKSRHKRRRLTHSDYLKAYKLALKGGGFIEFKTDSENLFDFTIEECESLGLNISMLSRDLHNSDLSARHITTQYENRFRLLGRPIHYCRIVV